MFLINTWKNCPRPVVLCLKPDVFGFKEKSLQKKMTWPLRVLLLSACPLDLLKTGSKASPSEQGHRDPRVLKCKLDKDSARISGLGQHTGHQNTTDVPRVTTLCNPGLIRVRPRGTDTSQGTSLSDLQSSPG